MSYFHQRWLLVARINIDLSSPWIITYIPTMVIGMIIYQGLLFFLIIIPTSTILFINGDEILEWYSSWTDIVIVVYRIVFRMIIIYGTFMVLLNGLFDAFEQQIKGDASRLDALFLAVLYCSPHTDWR